MPVVAPGTRPSQYGWQHVQKRCITVPAAIYSQVTIEHSGECALFCDLPISIALETPDKWLGPNTEFRWKGEVHKIWVDPGPAHSIIYKMCNLTLFYGRPDLGFNWQRPDPDTIIRQKHAHALAAWAIGADTVASGVVTYPYGPPLCPEAVWIYGFEWTRDGGTVEGLQLAEQATGATTRVLTWRTDTPADRGSVFFPKPWRIAQPCIIYMYGSIEAVVTPCTLHFIEAWQ